MKRLFLHCGASRCLCKHWMYGFQSLRFNYAHFSHRCLAVGETEISQRAVTWILWCSCSVVVTVNGRRLLVHFVSLLTLLYLATSGSWRVVSAPRTVQTAVGGQQTLHLHRGFSRRGLRTGVDRRRWDGWQGVSQDCVFIGDVRRAATLVPHLIWQ